MMNTLSAVTKVRYQRELPTYLRDLVINQRKSNNKHFGDNIGPLNSSLAIPLMGSEILIIFYRYYNSPVSLLG